MANVNRGNARKIGCVVYSLARFSHRQASFAYSFTGEGAVTTGFSTMSRHFVDQVSKNPSGIWWPPWARRRHHYDFVALNSDVVLFRVDALASEQAKFAAFIETVCDGIARGQRELPRGSQRVPLAVAEMRRLHQERVITGRQYEDIKKKWFTF